MKNRRILVSVAMLLLSAVLLSSASFAWFSMNTTVNVDGIEFEAYSDSLFLEISKSADAGFTPEDISFSNVAKKTLRPIAYGYLEDFDGLYNVTPSEITATDAYYTVEGADYYKRVEKSRDNDTVVLDAQGNVVYDYIRVDDEEFELPSSVAGYYMLNGGLSFGIITNANDFNGIAFEKKGNDYIQYTGSDSVQGLYYVVSATPLSSTDEYLPSRSYYSQVTDDAGNVSYVLASGLNAGTRLKGYWTLEASAPTSTPDSGIYYLKNGDGDYVAFEVHEEDNDGLDGYWYRGYSENIDFTNPGDGEPDNISGVVGGMNAQDSDYVLFNTVYLRMAEGSANATNLRISSVEIQGSDYEFALTKAVRVIFVVNSSVNGQIARIMYNNETGKFTNLHTGEENSLLEDSLFGNASEVITVDMYVYYDGTHASVATHEYLNLSGHSISVGFEIDKPAYAN